MLIDLAVRFMAPALIVVAGLVVLVVIHVVGGSIGAVLSGAIRAVFAILSGLIVGLIRLARLAGRGIRELYWRIRA